MKKNTFSRINFSMMKFCRNKARRRLIACVSAVTMIAGSALGGTVVLNPIGGNGGAEWNSAVGATVVGNGTVATASLLAGKNAGLIDWQSLSIGNGQTLNFNGQMFYNVVSGGNASQIAGTLNANGSVWVFNPAGVSFMNGAQVNVAGLFGVAAANLANKDTLESEINAGTPLADMSIPQLGDMMGDVSVAKGVSFNGVAYDEGADTWTPGGNAAGVTLLGKNVSVQGGSTFNADRTTIAAGGKLVVDKVEGGTVTINVSDFSSDDDIAVTFEEDTTDGASVDLAGDLDVATEGKVFFNEGVVAAGNVNVGGLKKAGSEVIVSPKQLSVASGKLLQGKSVNATAAGKVAVAGDINATDGDIDLKSLDSVEVAAAGSLSATGAIKSDVKLTTAGTLSASTITLDGGLTQTAGGIEATTLTLGADGNAVGGTVNADAVAGGKTVEVTGDVNAAARSTRRTARGPWRSRATWCRRAARWPARRARA